MKIIQEIMEYLGITEDEAQEVRDYIDEWLDVDWSEATQKECNSAYKEAWAEVNA